VFVTFSSQARSTQNSVLTMCNSFQSWHGSGAYSFPADTFRAQLQIGSSLWPDRPLESHEECPTSSRKTLAMHSSLDGVSINPPTYKTDSFIIGLDLEQCTQSSPGSGMAALSGWNTRTGNDQVRLTFDSVTQTSGWEVDRHLAASAVRLHGRVARFWSCADSDCTAAAPGSSRAHPPKLK
jgi:hypothetical protein